MYDALDNPMEEVLSSLTFIHVASVFKNASLASSHRAFERNSASSVAKRWTSVKRYKFWACTKTLMEPAQKRTLAPRGFESNALE
jgi:hypothetical protein